MVGAIVAFETIADKLSNIAGFPVAVFESSAARCFPLYDGVTVRDGFAFRLYVPGRTESVICEFIEPFSMSNARASDDELGKFIIEVIECLKDQAFAPFGRAISMMAQESATPIPIEV